MRTNHKMALARCASRLVVAARAAAGRPKRTVARRGGIRWALDLTEAIDLTIYLLGAFERRTLARCRQAIRPGDTVVDAGANIGSHTLPFAAAVGPAGRVLACEPTAFAFGKLRANIELNPSLACRIRALQVALIGRAGDALPDRLYASWPLTAPGAVHAKHAGRLEATAGAVAVTLDDIVGRHAAGRVSLIKIDVDGHEPAVLQGASQTLARDRPVLVMELAPYVLAECGTSVKALLEPLVTAGYGLETLADRPLPMEEQALCAAVADGASLNVVAVPR